MNKTIIQILKNAVSSWGALIVQSVIGLLMVPILLQYLGKEGYGIIGIIGAIVGFSGLADLGLRSALERELSEKVILKDEFGFKRLSSTAMLLYVVIAILIGTIISVIAPWLCSLFNVSEKYQDLVILLLQTYAFATLLFSFITPVFAAGICSFMRYDVQNHITTVSQILISSFLFVFLYYSNINPIIIWCLVMLTGSLVRIILMLYHYRRICYGGQLGLQWIDFTTLRPLFKLGSSMYVLQLTQMIAVQMDPLIISKYVGPVGIALYQAGSKLPQMVNPMVTALTNQLTPLTTRYHISSKNEREQQVFVLGTKYTMYLGSVFTACMILYADSFCHLWLFKQLGNDVVTVALIIKMWAVANLLRYAGVAGYPILLAKKKMTYLMWLNVPTSIFNVILSVYLVGYTNMGVAGVMVGTIVTDIIRRIIGTWYMPKILNLSIISFIKKTYLMPLFILFVMIYLGSFINYSIYPDSWVKLVLLNIIICCTAIFLIICFEWHLIKKVFA